MRVFCSRACCAFSGAAGGLHSARSDLAKLCDWRRAGKVTETRPPGESRSSRRRRSTGFRSAKRHNPSSHRRTSAPARRRPHPGRRYRRLCPLRGVGRLVDCDADADAADLAAIHAKAMRCPDSSTPATHIGALMSRDAATEPSMRIMGFVGPGAVGRVVAGDRRPWLVIRSRLLRGVRNRERRLG
jgi:hypothetical protein